jgi:phage terminase large subunit
VRITVNLGEATAKQTQFYSSTAKYTAFGGARGGGKSHALRIQAILGAVKYPGSKTLIVRRTYSELERVVIEPFLKLLPAAAANYNSGRHTVVFGNGSIVRFGHFAGLNSELEYQGQEYDRIMIDEATQLSERQFRSLGASLRGSGDCPKQMYLTANPGGVGHYWFKRLFVDRRYENGENESDYFFIPAVLDDNPYLMRASPEYAKMLDALPKDIRRAHRFGDWNAPGGRFFSEFSLEKHTVDDFSVPESWVKYRAFDYGLDMFACVWVAVDYDGTAYVFREVERSGLIVSEAAALMKKLSPPGERIITTAAPPDMWSRQKDSGKTMAEIFTTNGIGLSKVSNARVAGWLQVRELMNGKLKIFKSCERLIENLGLIQVSRKNPGDCSGEPHEVTHICDALRYFAALRYAAPEIEVDDEELDGFRDFMIGS